MSFLVEQDDNVESPGTNKVVAMARRRFTKASEKESEFRKEAKKDLEFKVGNQWPENVRHERDVAQRPCLTINKLPSHIKHVTNEFAQSKIGINVSPVDSQADKTTAEVLQGLIRSIEYSSMAAATYNSAFESAVTIGKGFIELDTEFESHLSFEQNIKIKWIKDPFSVYLDPEAKELDFSDSKWAIKIAHISREAFRAAFPKKKETSFSVEGEDASMTYEDSIVIAYYYVKEEEPATLYQLQSGESVIMDSPPEDYLYSRKTMVPTIKKYKLSGSEVLESSEWAGSYIPIVPVIGNREFVNGKDMFFGMIRNARDAQELFNIWVSAEAEMIGNAPKAPFIGAVGQFEGREREWSEANRVAAPYLEYNTMDIEGKPVPPPQRIVSEPPIAAISNARAKAIDDLKSTTGVYDASLGAKSNEVSGVAIRQRVTQAQTSNFHFSDSMHLALGCIGRQLVELIPKIYDTERTVRIIGEEDDHKLVTLFDAQVEQVEQVDLSLGTYDVIVMAGPSFATKRREAVEAMVDMSRSYPGIVEAAGDLLIKNMDWPGAKEISERLKKLLPPEVRDNEDGEDPVPPEVQKHIEELTRQAEELAEQLEEAKDIKIKEAMHDRTLIKVALINSKKDLLKEMSSAEQRGDKVILAKAIDDIDKQLDSMGGE